MGEGADNYWGHAAASRAVVFWQDARPLPDRIIEAAHRLLDLLKGKRETMVELDPRETRSMMVRAGTIVACLAGRAWVTMEGDGTDHILEAGGAVRFMVRGRLAVSGLEDSARLRIAG